MRFGVRGIATWIDGDLLRPGQEVPSRLRRRMSRLSQAIAATVSSLAEQTDLDLRTVALVHGSALGEIAVTAELLRALQDDPVHLSPTQFHNSVHNTPTGYLSIATENRSMSTSIAAGTHTSAMALLEATTLLRTGTHEVIVVLADEALPAVFGTADGYPSAVFAMHVTTGRAPCSIDQPARTSEAQTPTEQRLKDHPCRFAWGLAHRFAGRQAGPVALSPGPRPWAVQVQVHR